MCVCALPKPKTSLLIMMMVYFFPPLAHYNAQGGAIEERASLVGRPLFLCVHRYLLLNLKGARGKVLYSSFVGKNVFFSS